MGDYKASQGSAMKPCIHCWEHPATKRGSCQDCYRARVSRYLERNQELTRLRNADPEDYEAKVRLLAYELSTKQKYSPSEVLDVKICLWRGVLKGDIDRVAKMPRHKVVKIMRDYNL